MRFVNDYKSMPVDGVYTIDLPLSPDILTDPYAIWDDNLDDVLFNQYLGFVKCTVVDRPISEIYGIEADPRLTLKVVTSYEVDKEAYEEYINNLPPEPEPEPPKPSAIALLKAQVNALSERNEFLEDCIAEMAGQVYNY